MALRYQVLGPLARDYLEVQLDFCIASLFGKLGAASITYDVTQYQNELLEVTTSDPLRFRQALAFTSKTLDGQSNLRFKLLT